MITCKNARKFHAALAIPLCVSVLAPCAWAQSYPSKAVRIVLPYLGSAEFAGRWIAAKLSLLLGQQVIVDPRPGAGGKIGHELVARHDF